MPINPYTSKVEGKPVWNDLSLTNYPWYLDNRQTSENEGEIDPITGNPQFKLNVNFEERTRTTKANDYYVMAEDINALQDSMIAVQRTLGVQPYGIRGSDDVAKRLDFLESFVVMSKSIDEDGFDNLDKKYMWGGSWPENPSNSNIKASPISIKTHRHTGDYKGAQKIDLTGEVTGNLSKNNLDLSSGSSDMLSSEDIYTSRAKTMTISRSLDSKYDKSGGVIGGSVTVSENFKCLTMAEIDATLTRKSTGIESQDYGAYSGYARKGLSGNKAGDILVWKEHFRYGQYVAGFRMKVKSNSSSTPILKITIGDGQEIHTTDTLSPNFFASSDYEMFYIEFNHKNRVGTSGKKKLDIKIHFYNGITDLNIDSIVIQPVTTALYDDSSFLI